VVTPSGRAPLDVYLQAGRVAELRAPSHAGEAARTIDARGCFVLPGMVDTHVHLMDPGDGSREDFPTGTRAAIRQGVTTIIEHTHSYPVTSVDRLAAKRAHLEGRSWTDYGLAAHAWTGGLADVAPLWRAGVSFFKVFTCATHGVPATVADSMLDLLEVTAGLRIPTLIHCEDDLITARNERRLRSQGRLDGMVISAWRSREAEEVAVATVAILAASTGAPVTVAHASTPAVLTAIDRVRRDTGATIGAETCPQYLLLREEEAHEHGSLRKFTPPARARHLLDEEQMWAAFNSGLVSHISTDHAPSTPAQKAEGDIWSCHFGLPGLDTTAPILIDAALTGRTSLERVVEAYAERPAQTYRLAGKGRLEPGADADLVVVDPALSRTIVDADVVSRAGWSPYSGRTVRGGVTTTVLRGQVVVAAGEPVEGPPSGRFLPGPGMVT